ncbi:MAG TPA: hypothetical protein VF097_02110 [Actinomycetota bacterium]
MSDHPTESSLTSVPVPAAAPIAVLGALLHQVAVYVPVLRFRAGPDSFTESIVSFTDGFRAALPHLAVTVLGLAGAFLILRRRELAAGLFFAGGTMSLVTFAIAIRGAWWAASAGSLPIVADVGLYLGLAGAALLLAAGVLSLRGLLGGGRLLPAVALASFFLGAWLIPWLAWRAVEQPPPGLDVGAMGWFGRALIATTFAALALAVALMSWTLSPTRGRGLGTIAGLALVLLVVGIVAGWSLVRILHAGAWGAIGVFLGLVPLAFSRAVAVPTLPGAFGAGSLILLLTGILVPVLATERGGSFRPIPWGDVPVADLLPNAVNELPAIALAALGVALIRHRDLAAGLLIGAAGAAIPWVLLYSVEGIEVGMWLRIGGLLLAAAAAWALLATSGRPGSVPPSPR